MPRAARAVLKRMEVPPSDCLFVIGCFASRLTFSSQQCRALNLISALFDEHILEEGKSVAVVGAGLAGLTAAAAAARRGCQVTIFDRASQIMAMQRGNHVRYVHPNILDWPKPGSEITETTWPFLNWRAETVHAVVDQIEADWEQLSAAMTVRFGYEVDRIDAASEGATVIASPLDVALGGEIRARFDCVILAVGFGIERTMEGVPGRSYWMNDELHQEQPHLNRQRPVLVTGCGDGGLIDVLRLKLRNFAHADFVAEMLSDAEVPGIRDDLLRIEDQARSLGGPEASVFLAERYAAMSIPKSLEDRFRATVRGDYHVTLNGPAPTALTLGASILHRFITFLLCKFHEVTYLQGSLLSVARAPDGYDVNIATPDGNARVRRYENVVVRHGPEPIVQKLIPPRAVVELCKRWRQGPDPTLKPLWRGDTFRSAPAVIAVDPEKRASRLLQEALRRLGSQGIARISVGLVDNRIGYLVMPKRSDLAIPDELLGFPVKSEIRGPIPRPPDVQPQPTLAIGSRVYCMPDGIGQWCTLGCFVQFEHKEIGFLSTAHGFAPGDGKPPGSDLFHRLSDNRDENPRIATLRSQIIMSPSPRDRRVLNVMDVSAAVLLPDVTYSPTFPGEMGSLKLVGSGAPRRGDRVFKIGGRSGLTRGAIASISATAVIDQFGNPAWIHNAFIIEPEGTAMFSHQGDSGSIVVRQEADGAVVLGMLLGTDRRRMSMAFPIQPALEAMNCRLVLHDTFRLQRVTLCP
jgi:Pyridine nucleotide-disulphide oxidoreductase